MLTFRMLAIAAAVSMAVWPAAAQTPEPVNAEAPATETPRTFYGHLGRGNDETTGGLGVLWAGPRFALGLDIASEGTQDSHTYGRYRKENAYSINILIGFTAFRGKHFQVVPFGLVGARSYETYCPTGDSYLGLECYAGYESETHYKFNYGGGAVVKIQRIALGVRATGESVAAILGINW